MTAGARSLAPPEASAPRCSTRLLWLCNDRRRRLLNSSPFCTSPVHLAFEKAVKKNLAALMKSGVFKRDGAENR
jgi:hypothetical protein